MRCSTVWGINSSRLMGYGISRPWVSLESRAVPPFRTEERLWLFSGRDLLGSSWFGEHFCTAPRRLLKDRPSRKSPATVYSPGILFVPSSTGWSVLDFVTW